jgi:hypothetical protein
MATSKNSQGRDAFIVGFVVGILVCFGLNIYSVFANYEGCIDCYGEFGFPIHFGNQKLFMALEIQWWPAFLFDVGFALVCGVAVGFFFRLMRARSAPLD